MIECSSFNYNRGVDLLGGEGGGHVRRVDGHDADVAALVGGFQAVLVQQSRAVCGRELHPRRPGVAGDDLDDDARVAVTCRREGAVTWSGEVRAAPGTTAAERTSAGPTDDTSVLPSAPARQPR